MGRTYSRRELLRLAAAGAGAAWLAACGGNGSAAEDDDPEAPALLLRPELANGSPAGRLRLGILRETNFLTQPLNDLEQQLVHARLLAVDPRAGTLHGDLATTLEVVDPLELRFELRPNVFFHPDDESLAAPVTAEHVRRSLEAQQAVEGSLFAAAVSAVETPDARTVVLRLTGPFAFLFELLASPDASIRGDTNYSAFRSKVGAGPFVPSGQDSTGHVLLANPRYHQPSYPRLQQINALSFEDARALDEAFIGSRTDVRHHARPADAVAAKRERPDILQTSRPARALIGLGLSLLPAKGGIATHYVEAFQDERVRRAVSLALDRPALAALDEGFVASPTGAGFGADSLPYAELNAHPLYTPNPAEAARLLDAAGHPRLSFRIDTPALDDIRAGASLVGAQLREAGFDALVRYVDSADWEQLFLAGDFEAALFELRTLSTPGVGLRLHTTGGLDGRFSLWGYSNPVVDAAVSRALSQLLPTDRGAAIRESQRILLEQVPAMFPLVTPAEVASVGPRVSGYEFDAYEFNASWLAANWERVT